MTDSSDYRLKNGAKNQSEDWFNLLPKYIQAALHSIPEPNVKSGLNAYFVAFSGGLDSSLLLELAHRYLSEFRHSRVAAIHVHHGLSAHADHWLLHCEQVCQRLNIQIITERVVLSSNNNGLKKGLEEAARAARYRVFEQALPDGAVLLQGHHQNDQAETVLLRLMRGAGVAGIAGIPLTRALNSALINRPFLNISKSALLQLAQSFGLKWVEDDSNESRDFDRNFIRHEIIPSLESRWPGAVGRLSMSASHCREGSELEDALAQIDLNAVLHADFNSALAIDELSQLSANRQTNVVRYWIRSQEMGFPGEKKFRRIWSEVLSARDDSMPVIEWPLGSLRRYRGALFLVSKHKQDVQVGFNSEQVISVDNFVFNQAVAGSVYRVSRTDSDDGIKSGSALCIRMPNEIEKITVRFRQGGELFKPAGKAHHRPLKKWLHDCFIPPWLRDSVPLLYYNECLIAVGDYLVADGAQKESGDCNLSIEWETQCGNRSIVKC